MKELFNRTQMLLGKEAIETLKASSVLIVGAGGVGSYAIEAIARSGVGRIGVCDSDVVCESNINRQLFALNSTLSMKKVEVAKNRILDINPDAVVEVYDFFFDDTTVQHINFQSYDFIVDAIDSMESKILLIKTAKKYDVRIISALSAGNKLDPCAFEVSDIYNTSVCPIAKILRRRLKEEGIVSHRVVYSKEPCVRVEGNCDDAGKRNVGSISFVPSVMGLILAKETVLSLVEREKR